MNHFLTVDLSAFYVDISKDRLYTFAAGSQARRSAQTAIYTMTDGLARLLAPILPVTTDDLWRFLPGAREDSVHLADLPADCEALIDRDLLARWQRLLALRDAVNVELERLRQEKTVGTSLEAAVALRASGDHGGPGRALRRRAAHAVHHVGRVRVGGPGVADRRRGRAAAAGAQFVEPAGAAVIEARRAGGVKCDRCWRYVPSVSDRDPAGLCSRCVDALSEAMESVG